MKKLCFIAIVALFAIGFAASDDDSSSNKEQTEQKQELSPQEKAKQEAEAKEKRYKEIMERAYKWGYDDGIQFTYYKQNRCLMWYKSYYGAPSTDEEMDIFKDAKAKYDEGFHKGHALRNEANY